MVTISSKDEGALTRLGDLPCLKDGSNVVQFEDYEPQESL